MKAKPIGCGDRRARTTTRGQTRPSSTGNRARAVLLHRRRRLRNIRVQSRPHRRQSHATAVGSRQSSASHRWHRVRFRRHNPAAAVLDIWPKAFLRAFPCRSRDPLRSARSKTMPNIINEVKLDFKDVLLRPKRSTLKSRAQVG